MHVLHDVQHTKTLSILIRHNMCCKRLHQDLRSLASCVTDGKHEAFMDSHKAYFITFMFLKVGNFWLRCLCSGRSQKYLITVIFYTFVVAPIPLINSPSEILLNIVRVYFGQEVPRNAFIRMM